MKPSERVMKRKHVRVPSGESKIRLIRHKKTKVSCGLCGMKISSASNSPKLSKTERRPTILFGGVLCSTCRDAVFENAIKVRLGVKSMDDLNLTMKKFVQQAIKKVGVN
jgi:ribosomal protein L34E